MQTWIETVKQFWQHIPEHISPIAFSIGPISIHWYGIMYVVVFIVVYMLARYRLATEPFPYSAEMIADVLMWAVFGVLIGGRLGYVLIYDLAYYLKHPLQIISPFDFSNGFRFVGIYGMSYHGGLVGVILVYYLFCVQHKISFFRFVDLFIPAVPLGYTFGRLGNFINGELFGRITTMPWGMYFPLDSENKLRHPSQLYEAFFEGIFLFILLWTLRKKLKAPGALFGLYIVGYGVVRFFIEYFREPDQHLGFVFGALSMGQILCLAMIVGGSVLVLYAYSKKKKERGRA